ncbi:MAG TPA: OstA-like protein [Saprospiraceae bacterium]|nr:OstA-like protein [Saprospiraceae bacterium]
MARMTTRCSLYIVVTLLGLPVLGIGQEKVKADTSKNSIIIIDHFGKLIEDLQGKDHVKWISKGLQLRIDSTNIYADSAVIFNDNRIYAYDTVVIQQGDSLAVFTDTLYYSRETDIADLIGEVVLRQGTKQLWTTDLSYHLAERYGEYHKGGVLIDKDVQMSSKRGIYYARDESMVFRDSVIVLHPKFNLVADSMRYLATQSLVQFTGPTNIYTKQSRIYCESGYYNVDTQVAEFNKNARYVSGQKTATADTIRYLTNTGDVTMLGHVNVKDKDKIILGNSLRYSERTGETWIKGEPAFYSDSKRKAQGAEIFYNEKNDQLAIMGGGEIEEGSTILSYEHFKYDEVTGDVIAEGGVVLRDTVSDFGVKADILVRSGKDESSFFYSAPNATTRALFYSIVDGDTLYIGADTLAMFNVVDSSSLDTSRIIKAYYDVRLFKSDMQGRTDSLVFHGRDSIFNFFGKPVLWTDTTQFTADSISMSLMNQKIHDVTLTHRALIISELMTVYYDQIKGKEIIAQFDSSKVKDMWVLGNAESIYYTRDEEDAFIGVNQTICSKMYFTFLKGQLQLLKYYGENTSSMTPMFQANHDLLRLEGFQWRPEERPLSVADVLK